MRVLQLIDSLNSGGAERVAVNLANSLVNKIDGSFLCSTRKEGLLKSSIDPKVGYLFLEKQVALDIRAIREFYRFIKTEQIDIIHAHSTSFFLATIIKLLNKKVKIVWHDHYGNSEFLDSRKSLILKLCSKQFDYIVSVNKKLENWAKKYLKTNQVVYLPNFASIPKVNPQTNLNGIKGKRIVCLANLREQKDHFSLIRAFHELVKNHPDWTLHLVGKDFNDDYSKKLKSEIEIKNLEKSVFLYGSRPDVQNILSQCEIGILSSKSEGLPLALLEYGMSKLPVIATKVGECESLLTNSKLGILVEPQNVKELTSAMNSLIENSDDRLKKALEFNKLILKEYSQEAAISKVLNIYRNIY